MPSRRRLTLLQKGLLLIAVPMLYQAVLVGVLLRQQRAYEDVQEDLLRTKNVMLQLDRIAFSVLESQSDLRMYLLGSDPVFAEHSLAAGERARAQVTALAEMVRGNPSQVEQARMVRDRVGARLGYNAEVAHEFANNGQERARTRVERLEGQVLMDAVSAAVEMMRQSEEEASIQRLAILRKAARRQNLLLVGGLLVNVVLAGAAALIFSRSIGQRLSTLSDNMAKIAKGETLPGKVGGDDEIGELDEGLHRMAEDLAQSHLSEDTAKLMLEKRNAELTRANRDLDHKNQENEMFVYSVSHDLRSPLVNLQGFSKELGLVKEDLQRLFDGDLTEAARERGRTIVNRDVAESVHYIQTAVTRLSAIIDALLRLSRAGRVDYQPEVVDLAEVVDRVIAAMRATIEERGAQVSRGELIKVWGDPTALEQIFANLIGNAVNYLDPNRPGRIEVNVVPKPPVEFEDMVVFAVKDNGLGIPEAYQSKVFGVFQRLHPNAAPGEGIGLPLVRRMVERHGGKIWLESKEGEGTTFFIALPSKEDSPLIVAPRKESIRFTTRPSS
jgi:signal transduction histidine kinase